MGGGSRAVAAFQALADRLALIGAWFAAACVAALAGLVLTEILVALLARLIPTMPASIQVGWEYSGYLMGAAFLSGAALTLRAGQQIRVEVVLRAAGPRLARILETVASLVGALVSLFLARALVELAWRTWSFGEVSQDSLTPLWIPQAALAFGAVLLALQMVARLANALVGCPLHRPELGAGGGIE